MDDSKRGIIRLILPNLCRYASAQGYNVLLQDSQEHANELGPWFNGLPILAGTRDIYHISRQSRGEGETLESRMKSLVDTMKTSLVGDIESVASKVDMYYSDLLMMAIHMPDALLDIPPIRVENRVKASYMPVSEDMFMVEFSSRDHDGHRLAFIYGRKITDITTEYVIGYMAMLSQELESCRIIVLFDEKIKNNNRAKINSITYPNMKVTFMSRNKFIVCAATHSMAPKSKLVDLEATGLNPNMSIPRAYETDPQIMFCGGRAGDVVLHESIAAGHKYHHITRVLAKETIVTKHIKPVTNIPMY